MNGVLAQIEAQARRHPDTIAVRSGEAGIGYRQLLDDVGRVAASLRRAGSESLGIYLDNGIEWIVVDLAALRAGVRVVPLPGFFSSAQLRHAIEAGAVDTIASAGALPAGVAGSGATHGRYRGARLLGVEPPSARSPSGAGGKLSFTSGSTGNPKGIALDARFIEANCRAIAAAVPVSAITRHLAILPYATLLENIAGIYLPLMHGKCVFAEASAEVGLGADLGLDPAALARTLARVRPDSLILTPQLLELVCALVERGAADGRGLRFVAVGGARVGTCLLQRARDAGIPVYEGYGLTEFASVATLNTPDANRPGSVGRPLPGVEVSIAADGEICLARWLGSPAAEWRHAVRVRTGDYGRVDDDGYLYVHGRKCNLIVLANGRNVSPEWVETELRSSPAIDQAFVYAESDTALAALVFGTGEDALLEREIGRINATLPPYARVRRWRRLEAPLTVADGTLTANGRLRRDAIRRELLASPEPSAGSRRIDGGQFSNHPVQETLTCH